MSHIECYKNHGIDYLRISEAVYVPELKKQKKHTIKNIGPLSNYDDGKPDFLKRFRKKWKEGKLNFDGLTYSTKSPTRNVFEFDNNQNYIELKNIGYFFPQNIYEKLGIDDVLRKIKSDSKIEYDLNGITKMLVFGRILDPASKKKTFENRNKYLFPVTTCDDLNDVYKALDVLAENSKKIQNRMNTNIKNSSIGRVTNLTYYDVDALYNIYGYPFSINGPSYIEQSETYSISKIHPAYNVVWSLSNSYYNQNCLQQNYPTQNKCTITRSSSQDMTNATLTATIKHNGVTVQTLTKSGLYAHNGFKGTYSSSFGSGQYTAPNPIFTSPSSIVIINSPNLIGATASYTGNAINGCCNCH